MGDTPQQAPPEQKPPEQTPPSSSPPPSSGGSGGLDENIAAALAYLFIPAIIWLILEPYKDNKFIRFHSFQSLFFTAASWIVSIVLGFIPIVGWIILPFWALGVIILWFVCVFKAFSKAEFKLPVIGNLAAEQAAK